MLSFRASLAFLLVAAVFATPAIAADSSHHKHQSQPRAHKKTTTHKSKKKAKKTRGQQAIDSARVAGDSTGFDPRALSERRSYRAMGCEHYICNAEVSGRSGLANKADARLPGAEEAGIWDRITRAPSMLRILHSAIRSPQAAFPQGRPQDLARLRE